MPTKLEEYREQYPQYSDLTDDELLEGVYQRSYTDLDRDEFTRRMGVDTAPPPAPAEPTVWERVRDRAGQAADAVSSVFNDEPAITEDFDFEARGYGPTPVEQELIDRPRFERGEIDEFGNPTDTAAAPKTNTTPDPRWSDLFFAGVDDLVAGHHEARGQVAIADYVGAEGAARGDYGQPAQTRGGLGTTASEYDRMFRARRADAYEADPEQYPEFEEDYLALQADVADGHARARAALQGAIDDSSFRRQRAATVAYGGEVQEFMESEEAGEAWDQFWDDPLGIMTQVTIRSVPNMAYSIPLAAAGSLFGPVGFAAGLGAGSGLAEYRQAVGQYLGEHGVDMNDADSLLEAATNTTLMQDAANFALTRSAIIGTADALTGGIATQPLGNFVKNTVGRHMTNIGLQTVTQMFGGGAGEAVAQQVTEGEIHWGEVGAEAAGEVLGGVTDVGGSLITGVNAEAAKRRLARAEANAADMLNWNNTQEDTSISDTYVWPDGSVRTDPPPGDVPHGTSPDESSETPADPTGPAPDQTDTIVPHDGASYHVRVDRALPDGSQEVTVTLPDGTTQSETMDPGGTMVDLVERVAARRAQPDMGEDSGVKLPEYFEAMANELEEAKAQKWAERNMATSAGAGYPQSAELRRLVIARARAGVAGDTEAMSVLADAITVKQNELLADEPPSGGDADEEITTAPEPAPPSEDELLIRRQAVIENDIVRRGEMPDGEIEEQGEIPTNAQVRVTRAKGERITNDTMAFETETGARIRVPLVDRNIEQAQADAQRIFDAEIALLNPEILESAERAAAGLVKATPEQTDEAITRSAVVSTMQNAMRRLIDRLPEGTADFLGPENEQIQEMVDNAEMDGVHAALVEWYDLNEAEATILQEILTTPEEFTPAEPTVEPVAPDASPPAYIDNRLRRDVYRGALESMGRDLTPGGNAGQLIYRENQGESEGQGRTVVGRTPSTNPAWFQDMVANRETKVTVRQLWKAIDKAIIGARLGVREARVIEVMLDEIQGERTSTENLEFARTMLEEARTARQDARAAAGAPQDLNDDTWGDQFTENEYDPEMTAESRMIFELMTEAQQAGVDEDVLERLAIMYDDNHELMAELERAINEQRRATGTETTPTQREDGTPAAPERTAQEYRRPLSPLLQRALERVSGLFEFQFSDFDAPDQGIGQNELTKLVNSGYVEIMNPDANPGDFVYQTVENPDVKEDPPRYQFEWGRPWSVESSPNAEGDLYIDRIGPNAGRVTRERTGPNQIAIKTNPEVLNVDFLFYMLQYLQPRLNARAKGTAQQAINKQDVHDILIEQFQNMAQEDQQLEMYFMADPVPEQPITPALELAKRQAIEAVQMLRSVPSVLATSYSSSFAKNQRISLVGQKITSVEDLAVQAQVYRDPRFETLRVIFTDLEGNVTSQVGISSRLPAGATAVIGGDMQSYLEELTKRARATGATGYFMLHNHPSGNAAPSAADQQLTQRWAARMRQQGNQTLQFRGHVVINHNNWSEMDDLGNMKIHQDDMMAESFMPTGGIAGTGITGPADLIPYIQGLEALDSQVVVVLLDSRHIALDTITIPVEKLQGTRQESRRVFMRAALGVPASARAMAIGQNREALLGLSGIVLDAYHINEKKGTIQSLASERLIGATGVDIFPEYRAPRVTPDTSAAFDYLRDWSLQERKRGMDLAITRIREAEGPKKPTGDLFGEDVSGQQAIQDEIRRRDAKRNEGQESAETGDPGDLFSEAQNQIDIEDNIEERRGTYDPKGMGDFSTMSREEKIRRATMEELVSAVYTDELTGVGNLTAYEQEAKFLPVQAILDVAALKWANDTLGYDAGDAILVAVAQALDQTDVEVYRIGGDEFIVAGTDEGTVRAAITFAQGVLKNTAIENRSGRVQGIDFTFGIGRSKEAANQVMMDKKTKAVEAGTISARGARPEGGTLSVTSARPLDMESGTNYVPMIGKHGRLPITANNKLVLGNGRIVRIPKEPVRQESILAVMQRHWGKRIYEGRVKGKMRLGFYRPGQGEIRLRNHNDAEVAAHELAHYLDDRHPWIRELYMQYSDEMKGVSYDVTKVFEGYAEFMRLYFTQETFAMERAPSFYDAWRSALEQHGTGFKNAIEDLQEIIHAWTMQGSRQRFASRVGSGPGPSIYEKWAAIPDWWDSVIQGSLDGLRRIKQITKDLDPDSTLGVYEKFRLAHGGSNAMLEATFMWGTPGKRIDNQGYEFTGEGLMDVFGDTWGDEHMGHYMLARRAREIEAAGKESGFRPDEIVAALEYEKENPRAREIFDNWLEFSDRMLVFAVQTGILGMDQVAKFKEAWSNYVPMHRVVESRVTGKKVKPGGNPFMRLKGSTRNVNIVWENIINQTGLVIRAGMVNDAKRSLFRGLAGTDRLGAGKRNAQGGVYAAPIGPDSRPVTITGEQVLRQAVEAMGWNMGQYRMAKEGMVQSEDDIMIVQMIENMEANLGDFVTLFETNVAPTGDVDFYSEGGKKHYFEIGDPLLWDSLQFMGPKGTNFALQILGGFSGALRRGVVAVPVFQIKNIERDTVNSWMQSSHIKVPAVRALRSAFRQTNNETYRLMVLNGGGFSNRLQGLSQQRNVMVDPTQLLAAYDRIMGRFENANRLAEYEAAIAAGESPQRAAFLSREISTDFAMRGSHAVARVLAIGVPFLNARAQGNYRVARTGTDYRKVAVSYAARGTALMLATLALYSLNKDDDRYKEMPEDIKDLYWVFFTGPGEDDYILFPKPFENGMIWGTVPERIAEFTATEDGEEFADAMLWMMLQTFNMDLTPQVFQPMVDLMLTGETFTGAPIIPYGLENVEPSEQFTWYTSQTMIEAGRALGMSPIKMEYAMRGYFGTMGTYALAISDAMIHAATGPYVDPSTGEETPAGPYGERETRGEGWKESWLARYTIDFMVNEGPQRRSKYVNDLYDLLEEATTVANTITSMQDRQAAELEEYLSDPQNQFLLGMVERTGPQAVSGPPLVEARNQLTEIRHALEAVRFDRTLSGDEKRVAAWELIRARNEIAEAAVRELEAVRQELGLELTTPGAGIMRMDEAIRQAGQPQPPPDTIQQADTQPGFDVAVAP